MMLPRARLLALVACFGWSVATAQVGPPRPLPTAAGIRELLVQRLDAERQGVGMVVGVITPEGPYVVACGPVDTLNAEAGDGDTTFEIGSITKVFTAMILADMVARGEVALEQPVAELLPPGTVVPSRDGVAITLRHLATHTAGLPRMPTNHRPADPRNPQADYTVPQLYAFLATCALSTTPGATYLYSNLGYGLLGHALARRAGLDYESLVRERVCVPLGLDDTRITFPTDSQRRRAVGHDDSLRVTSDTDLPTLAGAGALHSTVNDLLRFLAAQLGPADTPLADVMEAVRVFENPVGDDGRLISLAFGPPEDLFGHQIYWHNGGTAGFRSFLGFDRERGVGVVVLSNCSLSVDDLGFHLLDARSPLQRPRIAISLDPGLLGRYAGVYALPGGGTRTFSSYGSRLFMKRTGRPVTEVMAESETGFFIPDTAALVEFRLGAGGVADSVVVRQSDGSAGGAARTIATPAEQPLPRMIDTGLFELYAGRYRFMGDMILTVTHAGDRLWARMDGQNALEIVPESETRFFFLGVDAALSFARAVDGTVTHLVLHQGGLDQRAVRLTGDAGQ
jgi:CubicO group peptidase (beta-lactamase class C family)